MGIKNFFKIVDANGHEFEQLGKKLTLAQLKNKTLGFDASYFIYNAIKSNIAMCDEAGRPTAHLNTILNKVLLFNKHNITQIWIFDSPVQNEAKTKELQKREAARQRAIERKYKNHEVIAFTLTAEIVEQTQKLLELLGVDYIVAPDGVESEQFGANMTNGLLDYFVSGDSDVIVFGGNLLRVKKQTSGGTAYIAYEQQDFLLQSGLSRAELIKIAVLMGTDFNDKTAGMGVKTIIKKFADAELTDDQKAAAELFEEKVSKTTAKKAKYTKSKYDKTKLIEFLVGFNFSPERLASRLV